MLSWIVRCSSDSVFLNCRSSDLRQSWSGRWGPLVSHKTFPGDCGICHTMQRWDVLREDFSFDHEKQTGYRLSGTHAMAACLRCHNDRGPVRAYTALGCGGCHHDPHASALTRRGLPELPRTAELEAGGAGCQGGPDAVPSHSGTQCPSLSELPHSHGSQSVSSDNRIVRALPRKRVRRAQLLRVTIRRPGCTLTFRHGRSILKAKGVVRNGASGCARLRYVLDIVRSLPHYGRH